MSRRKQKKIDPLEQAIEAALSPGTFISSAKAWPFVTDAQHVAGEIEKIITREPDRAALLFETFITACHKKAEEIDDSSGDFGMLVENLFLERKATYHELEALSHYTTEPLAAKLERPHPDVSARVYCALCMRIINAGKSKS